MAAERGTPDVRIVEVGPRDGLQNIGTTVPTATKLELISRLQQTGLSTIEITSIVSPKAIPQLADCRQVLGDSKIRSLLRQEALRLPVLVPNFKGLDIANQYGVREVAVFVSATEGFSKANINATVDEGLSRARHVSTRAKSAGIAVRGYVSCIFADPYDGKTAPEAVLKVVRELFRMGCYEVSLGDTLGVGTAIDVKNLIVCLEKARMPLARLAGHFHDTYGQAVANVWQAYQCGIRVFDSSVGGLGGCPFAPGAKGNVATEDLVYLFDQSGVLTGVDLSKLVEIGVWISDQLRKTNDSRAGAALATKHQLAQKRMPAQSLTEKITIKWTLESESQELKVYRSGFNLKIQLDRPANGNALTASMVSDMTRILTQARTDPKTTRIALCATGKFFCTGMDLGKNSSPVARSPADSHNMYERLAQLFDLIDSAPQVTIACINGPALGGGVGLAFACDIRIAAQSATVALSEVKLGLCPATISKYVIRELGPAFAREAMLSARSVSMPELKSLGAIAHVVGPDGLHDALDEYLARLRVAAPEASSMCKELVRLDWVDAGGARQAAGIKNLFDQMMRSDGEAATGLKAFHSGAKAVDWDRLPERRARL